LAPDKTIIIEAYLPGKFFLQNLFCLRPRQGRPEIGKEELVLVCDESIKESKQDLPARGRITWRVGEHLRFRMHVSIWRKVFPAVLNDFSQGQFCHLQVKLKTKSSIA